MSLDVRKTDGEIEVRGERVHLSVDRATLRMQASSAGGAVSLCGFAPRAIVGGRALVAVENRVERIEEALTPLGAATRIELTCRTQGALELVLRIELGRDWPGLVLDLVAANRGEHNVRVDALDPFFWRRRGGAELDLPGDPEQLRFYRMGYQSWSPAGFPSLASHEPRPRLRLIHTIHYGPFTPPPLRGWHVSDFATSLAAPGSPGLTLGFLTHHRFLDHVALRDQRARPEEIMARVSTERLPLAPGETMRAERLWLGLDDAPSDGIATWAERAGTEMGARVPAPSSSGWCSWYQYFTGVTAEDIRSNTEALARMQAPVETIQIDDGFQAAVGDWLEWSDGFPEGVAPLAREIRSRGFRAGLWLAPFLVSRASNLARSKRDWILRGPGGRPRLANVNPAWKGRLCYALDPTHPEVLDWLRELGRTVRSFGFDYLKLDFLYAGALTGRRHDPLAGSAEAYRAAIQAFREGAGEDAVLLGCGAPLGPSIGLFDAMRIGPDVAPVWRSRRLDASFGIRAAPSAENSLRNILARAALHQRLWLNDPDCVLLRDRDTRLGENEVRSLAGAILASGGLAVVSDDLARLSDERRELLRRLLPPLGQAPELEPPGDETPQGLLQRLSDGTGLLYRVNLSARPRALEFNLEEHGFQGPVHVYDVWAEQSLGVQRGVLRFDPVPARGSLLLRLAPLDGVARVLGTTLHLGAGSLETAAVRAGRDGSASVSLRLPGARSGRVLVATPGREPLAVSVGFHDSLELRVASAGVGVEESD